MDGTAGPARLYAVAERSEHCITWRTYPGVRPAGSTSIAWTA
jgi:hypothetical protein